MSNKCLLVLLLLPVAGFETACSDASDLQTRLNLADVSIARGEYGAATFELGNLVQRHPQDRQARLLLAEVSLAAGRAAAAERQLRLARDLGASDSEVLPGLGRALIAQGKFEQLLADARFVDGSDEFSTLTLSLRGHAHLYLGQLPQGESMFRSALQKDQRYMPARVGLARVFIANGQFARAEAILARAIRDNPFSVLAHQVLGALYFDQNRFAEAEREFIDAIEFANQIAQADPLMLAHVGLIESQWRVGKRDKAIVNANDLLDNFPWHPLPKYVRALLAFDDGDYKLADEFLDSVLKIVPDHRPSLQLTAAANFAQGRLGHAEIRLGDVLADMPDDYTMIRLLADTYLRMGNAAQAVATISLADDTNPDPGLLDLLGTANLYAGNTGDALGYLRAAVAQNESDMRLQMRLAAALLNAGRIREADALMHHWPTNLHTERARMILRLTRFLREDKPQRAIEYAKRRRRDNPSDLHALMALAETAELSANREQAIRWLEIARERNPDALEPRLLLANYAERRGDHTRLLTLAREALALQPYNDTVLAHLGEAQLAMGDTSMALATFRESLRVAPDSDRNTLNLARAYLARGDVESANKLILKVTGKTDAAEDLIRYVIIEHYRRGDDAGATRLAANLQKRYPRAALGHSTEGDLHMLAGRFGDAAAAYARAQDLANTRTLALKGFTAALAAGLEQPANALRRWLHEHPDDAQTTRIIQAASQP